MLWNSKDANPLCFRVVLTHVCKHYPHIILPAGFVPITMALFGMKISFWNAYFSRNKRKMQERTMQGRNSRLNSTPEDYFHTDGLF